VLGDVLPVKLLLPICVLLVVKTELMLQLVSVKKVTLNMKINTTDVVHVEKNVLPVKMMNLVLPVKVTELNQMMDVYVHLNIMIVVVINVVHAMINVKIVT